MQDREIRKFLAEIEDPSFFNNRIFIRRNPGGERALLHEQLLQRPACEEKPTRMNYSYVCPWMRAPG